jgi:YfiH family protein
MTRSDEVSERQGRAGQVNRDSYLPADWLHKPENVFAITTLRNGGVSTGEYQEYNLAAHVGDAEQSVSANRAKLVADLQLPAEPFWLDQVHSEKVIRVEANTGSGSIVQADASVTSVRGVVCAVLTADCLPVFFCNQSGTEVAVAHAGWRGLHTGILSNTVKSMQSATSDILVSLGPAIGAQSFEVGEEVLHAFADKAAVNTSAFVASRKGHYLCDIYQLARLELQSLGIDKIAGGDYCTYRENHLFYSYRRQQNTGRMASLIWFQ